ncbi:MAG: RES family NAD+ phosphorylase, partial [Candidatus Acidiferrales bacterium]
VEGNLDLPRRLAREAKDAGFQALIVPSAAIPEGRNVVLFLDTLSETPVLTASQPIDLRR